MKIATKLTAKVAEFVNENLGCDIYPDNWDYYFHYPKHRDESLWVHLQSNYTEVLSEDQFIQIVKDILNREKMKTKCIVLGQENEPIKELKKIEFVKQISNVGFSYNNISNPSDFENIELVSKNYVDELDLIFAYKGSRNNGKGSAFLGHWNDGIA